MRTSGYLVIRCDACGREERMSLADVAPEPEPWYQAVPDGWWNSTGKLSWQLQDPFGWRPTDICPECIKLPLPALIDKITERSQEVASANGK